MKHKIPNADRAQEKQEQRGRAANNEGDPGRAGPDWFRERRDRSGKVADGQLIVIDELAFKAPKTKEMLSILRNVGIERSALIVTGQADRSILASARNLQKTKVLPAAYLNVGDMLNHAHLLMTEEAVKVAEGLWGSKRVAPVATAEGPKRTDGQRRAKADKPAAQPEPAKAEAVAEATSPKPRARRAAAAPEATAAEERQPKRPTRRAKTAPELSAEEAPKPEAETRPAARRRTRKVDEAS